MTQIKRDSKGKFTKKESSPMAISGFKGFNNDMTCRGFQFAEGETYTHEGKVKACQSGFHFCENPLDMFNYYEPTQRFHSVVGAGYISTHEDDSKIACGVITVGQEITHKEITEEGIKFIGKLLDWSNPEAHKTGYRSASSATGNRSASSATGNRSASSATGDSSASSATGYRSASSATGNRSASSATGYSSASSATGYSSASSATGNSSASSATGNSSASSATGDRSASSATGNSSASSATGNRSASSATGYSSASSATGNSSCAMCTGTGSKAQAGVFGSIALAFYNAKEERYEMRCAETGVGDGSDGKLKALVWYRLDENGNFVEVL